MFVLFRDVNDEEFYNLTEVHKIAFVTLLDYVILLFSD